MIFYCVEVFDRKVSEKEFKPLYLEFYTKFSLPSANRHINILITDAKNP